MTASNVGQSIDFGSMNATNIKSLANMNAFSGLASINDESARIRERKKKAQECLMNNVSTKDDKISIKANVKQQITNNDRVRTHFKNDNA